MANNKIVEEQIQKHPGALVEKIVTEALSKKAVDIHFEEEDNQQWAIVKMYNENEDQELGIRLHPGDKWALQFGYYDDEDEFVERLQPLAQPEIALIPQGLQKVMRKVLSSEEGLRVPGNLLSK